MQISRMISASRWYFHTRAGKENGEYLWRCAIVGSAIIKLLEQYGKDAPKYIGEYVKKMKMALLTN